MFKMIDYALNYAENGIAVIPIPRGQKNPVMSNWPEKASTDSLQIKEWWTKWPDDNIGIVTGERSGGLLVVDLDVREEQDIDGRETLRRWEMENGKLPADTWLCQTGQGGYHYYYSVDGEYTGKAGILEGVDIRSRHNCVIAPPSVVNGHRYRWEIKPCEEKLAEANDALYKLLNTLSGPVPDEKKFVYPDEIFKGERNDTLFKYACSLRAKGVEEEELRSLVNQANKENCIPPIDDREVDGIIKSALKYESGEDKTFIIVGNNPTGTEKSIKKGLPVLEDKEANDAIKSPPKDNADTAFEKTDSGRIVPKKSALTASGIRLVSETEEKEAEWLIPGYIPRNQITVLAGSGGTGKTTIWCSIAAAVSKGERSFLERDSMRNVDREPGRVLFFSAEDSAECVLKKRLRECGANLRNIGYVDIKDDAFTQIKFNSETLIEDIEKFRPELLIFDPIQSFVPANIHMNERNAMRQCLAPLISYGETYGVTSLIVVHANKMSNVWGKKRIADSADIWDISRSVLMTGETNKEGIFYLSHEKCNYSKTSSSILYSLNGESIHFEGVTDKKDRDFVIESSRSLRPAPARDKAESFILEYLTDGAKKTAELDNAAKADGISPKTLRNAKSSLVNKGEIIQDCQSNGYAKGVDHFLMLSTKENNSQA